MNGPVKKKNTIWFHVINDSQLMNELIYQAFVLGVLFQVVWSFISDVQTFLYHDHRTIYNV